MACFHRGGRAKFTCGIAIRNALESCEGLFVGWGGDIESLFPGRDSGNVVTATLSSHGPDGKGDT